MKIRASVAWFIAVASIVVTLVIWLGGNRRKTPLTSPQQTNLAPPPPEDVALQSSLPGQTSGPAGTSTQARAPRTNAALDTNLTGSFAGSQAEQRLNVLSNYNDMPVVFYGKVEDQFTNPVARAVIDFSIQYNNGYDLGVKRGQLVSDASGLFTVSGYTGVRLSAVPKKLGYALASTAGGGIYSHLWPDEERAHPDPNNPVVIKMWKLQGAQPLVGLDHKYKLPYGAVPMYFDLLAGKVVPAGGDLKITVSRAPGVMSGRNRLPWGVQIEAVNGGLMDSAGQEETTYWAPADGYQPSITISFSTNAWAEGFNRGFFVMSRGEQVFSKLGISFSINYNPDDFVYVTFGGVASTNGSRNWEGDPNTQKPQ